MRRTLGGFVDSSCSRDGCIGSTFHTRPSVEPGDSVGLLLMILTYRRDSRVVQDRTQKRGGDDAVYRKLAWRNTCNLTAAVVPHWSG